MKPWQVSRTQAAVAVAIIATAGLALLVAACGSPSSAGSGHSSSARGSTISQQPLAFSHCMRSHGVSNFPDPDSSGEWPKTQVETAINDPQYQGASQACGQLLPYGGPGVSMSPAAVSQLQTDMAKFARCMRSHGVFNWPAAIDQGTEREYFDPQSAGIDPNSPQVSSTIHACEHVIPASLGRPPGT
jgi:hypothetical protein